SDLANFSTGNVNTSFSTAVSGQGTFFVRVRAANTLASGSPSNEIFLSVGGASVPNAPTSLQGFLNGSTLTLTWQAPTTGDPPTSYVIEAGSSSGSTDLASISTG